MDQQIRIQKAKQKHTERCQCNQRYNSTVWSGNNQDKFSRGTAFQLLKQGYLKSDTGIFLFPTTNNSAKNKLLLRNFGIFIAIATGLSLGLSLASSNDEADKSTAPKAQKITDKKKMPISGNALIKIYE